MGGTADSIHSQGDTCESSCNLRTEQQGVQVAQRFAVDHEIIHHTVFGTHIDDRLVPFDGDFPEVGFKGLELDAENSLAVLTTRDPDTPDTRRYIFAVFLIDEYFDGDNTQELLMQAVSTLPAKQRQVFCMKYFEDKKYEEMYLNCPIAIHVDAGNSRNGKTRELIPELVGWIRACGYDCSVKPDSFVASTISDTRV